MSSNSQDDNHRQDAPVKPKLGFEQPVTLEPEEYDALMAELPPPESDLPSPPSRPEIDERFRKIEFYMMIIVGLVLIVLIISKSR